MVSAQVVVSFLMSAHFTLVLVVLHFLLSPDGFTNPLDQALQDVILPKAFMAKHRDLFERWTTAVESAILAFSDTQLVTSIAILLGGGLQLRCGISLYHWQTIVDLAWFSTLTHLTTLTCLRHYFRYRPFMATCRVLVMGVVLILLSLAFVPTGYAWQRDSDAMQDDVDPTGTTYTVFMSSPAICLFSSSTRDEVIRRVDSLSAKTRFYGYSNGYYGYNATLVALSLAYLLTSYLCRVVRVSKSLTAVVERWFKVAPLRFLQCRYRSAKRSDGKPRNRILRQCYKALLLLVMTLAEAFYETGNSMLWEIVWLSAALGWGTFRLLGLRAQWHPVGEDQWGFGQILPLVLSILPIWCLFTSSFDARHTLSTIHVQPPRTKGLSTMRRIKKTAWFRSLTSLLISMGTILASYLLLDMPATVLFPNVGYGIDILITGPGVGLMLTKYAFALTFCIVVWTIFASVCLAIHFRPMKCSRRRKTTTPLTVARGQGCLRNCWWFVVVVSLLILQSGFIITMLITPRWLVLAVYG